MVLCLPPYGLKSVMIRYVYLPFVSCQFRKKYLKTFPFIINIILLNLMIKLIALNLNFINITPILRYK